MLYSFNIKNLSEEVKNVWGYEELEFAECITMQKEEICPYPLTEEVFEDIFGEETEVTTLATVDPDNIDETLFVITTTGKTYVCMTQDEEGLFYINRIKYN